MVLLWRMLRRWLALLLRCRGWINELWWLHPHVSHATTAGDTSPRLGRRPFVLPRRCRRWHLMRHEPWTIARGGRIGCGYHGRRETSMMTNDCCLTRRLQIDGRCMTVHSAVQRTASGGIPTRQCVVILLLVEVLLWLLLLLVASVTSAFQTRLAPQIDIKICWRGEGRCCCRG